ncbi:hypothetical protein G6L67_04240 [Agrobacterium tumefaciens]|uniref:Uncharacterized protein n=1 Tax=Agrobacterium tumefaciens str. Kerr 14 TaxID=1183424 RepID=A0A1S7Q3W4_AGRTU|nr:hypothetical protein [Agrobacterium tumefaciens]AYM80356.1 hypothetical protein At12D1_04690 [Agrobacterium tumefaciens]NTE91056.1 hypothetical protein [Agrobacterium tumefaciens]CUX30658.1 conserved exported hypothetical protein [Agrobacterium tumefaciens str. Kerr 14]
MSPTKKDRNIQSNIGKDNTATGSVGRLGAAAFALAIASALKTEFGDVGSSVKTISKLTSANQRAVKNWLDGKNGPSGEFLILLCRHSENVLETFLMLSGRSDLVKVKKYRDTRIKLNEMIALLSEIEEKE